MALILRPLGQRHDPGRDLDDENDEANPEEQEQPAELTGVLVVGGGPVQGEIALHKGKLDQPLSPSPLTAREPKNEVVIAAAAMSTPARERSSLTARSCASSCSS